MSEAPGPGNYDAKDAFTKNRVQSYKMGSVTQRTEMVSRERVSSPGPGNYDSPSRLGKDCATYTIGQKREEKIRGDSPGPGAYNANESVLKDRVVSHKMGSTSRTEIVHKETSSKPGPGAYDSPSKLGKGVCYSIGEKREERIKIDSPGPGAYTANDSVVKERIRSTKMSKTERGEFVSKHVKD